VPVKNTGKPEEVNAMNRKPYILKFKSGNQAFLTDTLKPATERVTPDRFTGIFQGY